MTDARAHRFKARVLARVGLTTAIALASSGFACLSLGQTALDSSCADNVLGCGPDGMGEEIKRFAVSPLHWERRQWLHFGGVLAAVDLAYQYDDKVRNHFRNDGTPNYHEAQDALPAAVVLGTTWLWARASNDEDRRTEANTMIHATVLGAVSVHALKLAIGRKRPGEGGRGEWNDGARSFPSGHVTVAFAIATVLAESGDDRHRLGRRLLGYGIGAWTAYERVNHDSHWLSDTVAGAGLGLAAAHFAMNHQARSNPRRAIAVTPVENGALFTYSVAIH